MRQLRQTYVHRGDALRRRKRIQRTLLIVGLGTSLGAAYATREPAEASAETIGSRGAETFHYMRGEARNAESRRLSDELAEARGELNLAHAQLERAQRVIEFSTTYQISADLAADIFDVALAERIDPELAFRVVRVESNFRERATSPVGAVGLAQVMLPTARYFSPDITREELYDRQTNLRIGFRYLRALIVENKGDVRTALLVYNRGPTAVRNAVAAGLDPANGYEKLVGYEGSGRLD